MKLELSVLFQKYDVFYKLKSKEENVYVIEKEIQDLLVEKRDTYFQLFMDQK